MVVFAISDLALALTVALATALGASAGGAIAGFVTLRAEERRQRFARGAEDRREERALERESGVQNRELKEAARLVDEELRAATDLIRDAVYQGRWWPSSRQLSADVYTRYRHVLAVALDDHTWSDVSHAFQELNRVNWGRSPRMPSLADVGGVGDAMEALERVDLLAAGQAVLAARRALAPKATPPDAEMLLAEGGAEAVAAAVFPVPDELDKELRPLLDDEEEAGDETGEGT